MNTGNWRRPRSELAAATRSTAARAISVARAGEAEVPAVAIAIVLPAITAVDRVEKAAITERPAGT
jgi:hypothetical protein